jgi:hypothetical protein
MAAILCHRLTQNSKSQPTPVGNRKYEWKGGVFNSRNIADRGYLWTNLRRGVADEIHATARDKPVAYLLACSNPSDPIRNVWALPEPVLYDGLASLPPKEGGQEYTIQIKTDRQRIDHCATSPDLTPYFRRFPLSGRELHVLDESREIDDLVRSQRKNARQEGADEDDSAAESETDRLLSAASDRLGEAGAFTPEGITGGRERVLSSIVRRRGQPTFRQHLLAAYGGRCAFSGCDVEAVLEAAHIIPYLGPETNHPTNGLPLRADLHTLFDLKLVAVDVATMTLLVSRSLAGTYYEQYCGRPIRLPDDPGSRPNREALEQHRQESGL